MFVEARGTKYAYRSIRKDPGALYLSCGRSDEPLEPLRRALSGHAHSKNDCYDGERC